MTLTVSSLCFSRKKNWWISNVICMDKPFHVIGRHWKLCIGQLSQAVGSTAGLGPHCLVSSSSNTYSKPSFSSSEIVKELVKTQSKRSTFWVMYRHFGIKDIRHSCCSHHDDRNLKANLEFHYAHFEIFLLNCICLRNVGKLLILISNSSRYYS